MGESQFAGIWYPTFTYNTNEMFVYAARYLTNSHLSRTTIRLMISEAPHYIKNVQSPIAKRPEVFFRTLLFAFLCLELCAMSFLIAKLFIMPLYHKIQHRCLDHRKNNARLDESEKDNHP